MLLVWLASLVSDRAAAVLESIAASFEGIGLRVAWGTAIVATLGSLYYSEIAHFIPCEFCWYQRIAMYPLVVVAGVAVLRRDERARGYIVPLAVAGAILSTYHYTIQQFPSLEVGSCSTTFPCTAAWVWKFGFVSIPFMALACFGLIVAALLLDRTLGPADHQMEPTEEAP